jgi:hypothetical protein
MEKKFIAGLVKKIKNELNSPQSELSTNEKKRLKEAKAILESKLKIEFDSQDALDILQAILIIMEIMKEISPHLK